MYRVRRHDDRIEVEIEDETPEAVFREAIVALGDEITEERGGEPLAHPVTLEADDLSGLVHDLLHELLRLRYRRVRKPCNRLPLPRPLQRRLRRCLRSLR